MTLLRAVGAVCGALCILLAFTLLLFTAILPEDEEEPLLYAFALGVTILGAVLLSASSR